MKSKDQLNKIVEGIKFNKYLYYVIGNRDNEDLEMSFNNIDNYFSSTKLINLIQITNKYIIDQYSASYYLARFKHNFDSKIKLYVTIEKRRAYNAIGFRNKVKALKYLLRVLEDEPTADIEEYGFEKIL